MIITCNINLHHSQILLNFFSSTNYKKSTSYSLSGKIYTYSSYAYSEFDNSRNTFVTKNYPNF